MKRARLTLICLLGCITLIFGQNREKILRIVDEKNLQALIGANVQWGERVYVTDMEGEVKLDPTVQTGDLIVSYIGYETLTLRVKNLSELSPTLYLRETQTTLDLVTVTGTRFETRINEAIVSVDIIRPELLRSNNVASSDVILNKVPGVQMLDGQANIRGGSGYSYGAGSRVMVLVDDIPILQADAGFPNWGDVPIENLSQIEILKGASSTLYGSSALNGIINFRSAYATADPETRISYAMTHYLAPRDPEKQWWNDPERRGDAGTFRYESNLSFVHKRKWEKLDAIVSGFYNQLRGFNQNTDNDRGRLNVNLRYRATDRLSVGLNVLGNKGSSSSFFLWRNPGSGAMQPFPGTVSDRTHERIYIDPSITYFDSKNNRHKLLWRINTIKNDNNTNQSNASISNYTEYQFQRNFEAQQLVFSAGGVGYWNKTDSEILGDTTFYAKSYAAYVQADKKFGDKWTLSAGLRYEYVLQESPENFMGIIIPNGIKSDDRLISRLGLNYKLAEYTNLRASWGQGYRFPTLTERFVTTTFGSFSIFSNPNLEPETGWSAEVGAKQGFKLGEFKGFLDISGFVSEYQDMIEFTFIFEPGRFGFQPQNIGNTRISGAEFGIFGELKIGTVPINIFGGYTYINPVYKDFDTNPSIRNSVSSTENVLKYRTRHQFKIDAEAKYKKLRWGISVQSTSHMINIDRAFESVPPINIDIFGIGDYRRLNNKGFTLLDTRIIYTVGKADIALLMNNILNAEYTLRPALIEAPRNVGFRIDFNF